MFFGRQLATGRPENISQRQKPLHYMERNSMNGEQYYFAAIALTDSHPGVQFREMLTHDAVVGGAARLYFRDQWRDLTLMGWNTFCLEMERTGNKKWLTKIKELDENIMLNHLESQLMEASRNGKAPNRAMLEATVKALQGVTALNKVSSEKENAVADGIEIRFIPSLEEPVEPETWEEVLSRIKNSLNLGDAE